MATWAPTGGLSTGLPLWLLRETGLDLSFKVLMEVGLTKGSRL